MTFYGVLRGANKQKPGIIGTLIGYWLIGLPLGAIFANVYEWPSPLLGAWFGNVVALFISSSWVFFSVFVRIDWMSVKRITDGQAGLIRRQEAREHNENE